MTAEKTAPALGPGFSHLYRNPVWEKMRDRAELNRIAYDAFDHELRLNFAFTLMALECLTTHPPADNLWVWQESR